MLDQFMRPSGLQVELGQFSGLDGSLEIGLHKSDARLEVSDGSGRVAVALEFGEMTPVPSLGSLAIQDLESGFVGVEDSAVPMWHWVEWNLVVQMGFGI